MRRLGSPLALSAVIALASVACNTGPKDANVHAEPKPALDQKGTRRAPRVRIKDGVEVAVDGNPASLIDLSTVGAQLCIA